MNAFELNRKGINGLLNLTQNRRGFDLIFAIALLRTVSKADLVSGLWLSTDYLPPTAGASTKCHTAPATAWPSCLQLPTHDATAQLPKERSLGNAVVGSQVS